MPLGGKLFKFSQVLDLEKVHETLNGYEETESDDGWDGVLSKNFQVYPVEDEELLAMYSSDKLLAIPFRGEVQMVPETVQSQMIFFVKKETQFLLIVAPKAVANNTAKKLSDVLGSLGDIREARFTAETLNEYADDQEKTSVAFFDNIDRINMEKAALYAGDGGHVRQTDLWGDYIEHGLPWYVLGKERSMGFTVGLVRDGSICIFNNVGFEEYVDFVKQEIIQLVEDRGGKW